MFDVDGGAEAADVACEVVAEDYAAHGGFAGAGAAHEEDFAVFLFGRHYRGGRFVRRTIDGVLELLSPFVRFTWYKL